MHRQEPCPSASKSCPAQLGAHQKHLSHGCSLGGEKNPHMHTDTKESLRAPGFPHVVRWSRSSIPSRTALDLHRSTQSQGMRTPERQHTLGPALLRLHLHLSVTAAEELSRDMETVEVQGMLRIASKCAAPEQPPPLHCTQREQQGEAAAPGTRTVQIFWLQAAPRHKGSISKSTAANSRAGTQEPEPCSPCSATSSHQVAVLPSL